MQKQMWSLFLGLVSIILLLVGKSQAIVALQTCIVALGLPNTCLVCVICFSIKAAVYMELHEDTDTSKTVHEGRYWIGVWVCGCFVAKCMYGGVWRGQEDP